MARGSGRRSSAESRAKRRARKDVASSSTGASRAGRGNPSGTV
jgi:hypothetical protein